MAACPLGCLPTGGEIPALCCHHAVGAKVAIYFPLWSYLRHKGCVSPWVTPQIEDYSPEPSVAAECQVSCTRRTPVIAFFRCFPGWLFSSLSCTLAWKDRITSSNHTVDLGDVVHQLPSTDRPKNANYRVKEFKGKVR